MSGLFASGCDLNQRRRAGQNSGAYSAKSISPPRQPLKSLDQPLALEAGQPLDPEQAVQLIDSMLVPDSAQAFGFFVLRIAVDIVIADLDGA